MTSLYHFISTGNKCKIQIEFRCLNLNAQNKVAYFLYGKYMENHVMLKPMDKHILLLEYLSPSHTGEILVSFLGNN